MQTEITRILGIRYPIIMGGMGGVTTAPLVAAVGNAGGLGLLGAALWHKEELREQIRLIRKMSTANFGINIPMGVPQAEELVNTAIEEKVKLVTTSAGDPVRFTQLLQENGIKVFHVAATVAFAIKAAEAGVDAVVAEGSESGGMTSLQEISTMALLPQVADAIRCPVAAAGGIGDGRGLVAALALGASGVQMGTTFLAAAECEISSGFKAMMVKARETDTAMVRREKSARRIFNESYFQGFLQQNTDTYPDLKTDVTASYRGMGQIAGLVSEIKPAAEIIQHIVQQAEKILPSLKEQLTTKS